MQIRLRNEGLQHCILDFESHDQIHTVTWAMETKIKHLSKL